MINPDEESFDIDSYLGRIQTYIAKSIKKGKKQVKKTKQGIIVT